MGYNIVHSFIAQKNNIPYKFGNVDIDKIKLNFYSYLISFILLKIHHKNIVAIVNKRAYDLFMKYIPYDEYIFIDDVDDDFNYINYWSLLKVNALSKVSAPFIHVDGDVIIFHDLLSGYINDDSYDIITQNIEEKTYHVHYNKYDNMLCDFLITNKVIKDVSRNIQPYNCGVIGIKDNEIKTKYINQVNLVYNLVSNSKYADKIDHTFPMYLEQQVLGFIIHGMKLNVFSIINDKHMYSTDITKIGDNIGYTHLWLNSKYDIKVITKIKRKILYEYPEYYDNIIDFEGNNEINFENIDLNNINNAY